MRLPSALAPLVLLVYVATMTAYIYAFVHRPEPDYASEVGAAEAAVLAGVVLVHVALGFVISWPLAILAPLLPVVIAIPAGDYPGGWPEGPLWLGILLNEVFLGVPLVALGIAIRAMADRRMRPRGTPQST